jgi:regulator of protease activity HflC (stomatin/prohibitin superfamily)
VKAYFSERRWRILFRTFIILFVLAVLWPFVTVVVPAGQTGVLYSPLFGGTSLTRPLREGLNFILPWNKVTLYNMRVQVRKAEFEAVTKDGLHVKIGVIFRYRPHSSTIGRLHKAVGSDYASVLLDPAISAIVRGKAGLYSAEEIYGSKRDALQAEIFSGVVDPLNHNLIEAGSDPNSKGDITVRSMAGVAGVRKSNSDYVPLVELVDTLITNVRLPALVQQAIERKEEQQQMQQEYEFRLLREQQESVRKRIEAEGIRDFQRIIQSGITDEYLKWRGIEATLRLATSENSKTVIIGGGKTGMPLIFNTDDGSQRPAGPAKPKQSPSKRAPVRSDSFDMSRDDGEMSIDIGDASPSPKKSK